MRNMDDDQVKEAARDIVQMHLDDGIDGDLVSSHVFELMSYGDDEDGAENDDYTAVENLSADLLADLAKEYKLNR